MHVFSALSAGVVGLTLSYAIKISGVFQQCVKQSAEVENLVSFVLLSYTKISSSFLSTIVEQEAKHTRKRGIVAHVFRPLAVARLFSVREDRDFS